MSAVARYVISVRREYWGRVDLADALARVRDVAGLRVLGRVSGRRTLVEASASVANRIKRTLSDCCHVEPEVTLYPQKPFTRLTSR
jgi:hypothetical protein